MEIDGDAGEEEKEEENFDDLDLDDPAEEKDEGGEEEESPGLDDL